MSELLEIAVQAAHRAGAIQREGWGKPVVIREATRHDIKLQTDIDCESAIREILLGAFPDHALLGEEGGGTISPDRPTWIVDPLDGTVNYSRQIPHFCCSIALQDAGKTLVGVVYDPIADELFTAEHGRGAFLNGKPIHVSRVTELAMSNLAMGFSKSVSVISRMLDEMNGLAHAVHKIRIMGAAALDMAYVAAGRFDGFIEYRLHSWDVAAGDLLIREAGGNPGLTPAGEHLWDVRAGNGSIW